MKVLVGSNNPVKIKAVKESFEQFFDEVEVLSYDVISGVSDQPVNEETFQGAQNRAEELQKVNLLQDLNADYFVGIEGGISNQYGYWFAYGGVCIIGKKGKISFGTSPQFELPQSIVTELLDGVELGIVMDRIMKQENTKQRGGAISYLSDGVMDRKELYTSGIIVALVPHLHPELYDEDEDENGN